jgi:methionine transaminase
VDKIKAVTVTSRLPEVGTSIFAVMSKMAQEYGAINLSQGFPDFAVDEKIIRLIYQYMLEGNNQYAPMPGVPMLRQAIADVIFNTYQRRVDPETDITVTAGATEGIFASIAALIGAGDEVILFDPSYDSYDPAIRLNGGIPVHINLRYPDFSIDWELVRSRISPRTRMIMINTPHNPCGAVLAEKDLQELEKIVLQNNLIVLSDEVYERLIFDGRQHQSVLRYPALAARSLAVFSFGKTFHATGWKAGYVVAPHALTREVRKSHQFIVFSVNTPVQFALAEYLKHPEHYEGLGNFYQQKRDFFLEHIKGSSFEPLPCRGSYFQLLSYKNISPEKSEVEMAEHLTMQAKVASIPVSAFYQDRTDNRLLRFCFAKKEETLAKACEILRKL